MNVVLADLFTSLVIVGIMTRTLNWAFHGKVRKHVSYYLSFFISALLLLPVMAYLVGFDVMVAEYVVSLILWLVFDLVKNSKKSKKRYR